MTWNIICRKCTRQLSLNCITMDAARQLAIGIGWKFDGKSLICKKCAGKNYDPNPIRVPVKENLVKGV